MAKLLPMKPVERLDKDKVKQLAALIRGCIPDCKLEDFPADPEKACKRLQTFLCLWYPATSNKKADERKAFSEACGRLDTHETKAIVNNLHEYKAWLLRKRRNLKTGERTDPTLIALFNAILQKDDQGIKKSSSSSSMNLPGAEELEKANEKPVKRLRSKQPLNDKAEDTKEVSKPAKAIYFAFGSPGSQESKSCDIVSVSSGTSGGLMAPGEFSEEPPEPVKAGKAGTSKKPAAHVACKRPAAQKVVGKKPAKARNKKDWVVSKSFGFIHQTKATQKAYINAKPEMADKPYCLVNVQVAAGQLQDMVMNKVFAKAQEENMTKASLVHYKNELLEAGDSS